MLLIIRGCFGEDMASTSRVVIQSDHLQLLFDALLERGYQPVGPRRRDGAVVYDCLHEVTDLPVGWTEQQDAASYRLKPRADAALFGFNNGPHSWKKYLFPPRTKLWQGDNVILVVQRRSNSRYRCCLAPQVLHLKNFLHGKWKSCLSCRMVVASRILLP